MLTTHNRAAHAVNSGLSPKKLKLGKGVAPNARNLLDQLHGAVVDAAENNTASAKNGEPTRVEYENQPIDQFKSQSLSLKMSSEGEVESLRLRQFDTHSEEAVELEMETDGDFKSYTQTYSLGSMVGSVAHVTVNEATGTITACSDPAQRTENYHEDAYFEQEQLLWGD